MKQKIYIILLTALMLINSAFSKPLIQARIDRDQYVYAGDKTWFNGSHSSGIIKEFHWDFGDGQKGQGKITTHIYTKPGIYTAKLKVVALEGPSSTAKCKVTVLKPIDESSPMKYRAGLGLWGPAPWQTLDATFKKVHWEHIINENTRMGYNIIWFAEEHPYPKLVNVPNFPEAQEVSNERLLTNQQSLHGLIDMAKAKETTIGMLVYNIFVPDSFKAVHGVGGGDDTTLTRHYMSECTKALYRQYPEFGDLVVTVGEWPLNGAAEFCKAGIFHPISQMKDQPSLIIRDQQLYPDDMLYLAEGIKDWHPLVKISEEQFTGDALGPRGKLTLRATGRRVVYLVSRKPDGFFFGAYKVIKSLAQDARKQHAAGFCIQSGGQAEWLFRESFGYYMKNSKTSNAEDDKYFEKLISHKFGKDAPATLLLETADLNSRILYTIRRQYFSRNWNWRADCGLVLESFLAMPTYSSFNRPGLGQELQEQHFTHWLPREDKFPEDYLTIEEFVDKIDRSASQKVVTPEDTVRFFEEAAELTFKHLPALQQAEIKTNKVLWDKQINDMEFLAHLAKFYARKTEAAIAWQRWKKGLLSSEKAASTIKIKLADSINSYSQAKNILERMHGANAPSTFRMVASGWKAHYSYPYTIRGGMQELLGMFKAETNEVIHRIEIGNEKLPNFLDIKTLN